MKLILVGGFLGSGKTTAIVNACKQLLRLERKVAVITNDQGDQQVDHAFVKGLGISTREVSNGCFCCNYNQLDEHLESLSDSVQPDYIFAESVGSCTDLVATIARPLNKFKPEIEVVISVFADAELLISLIEGRASFLDEAVRYIYKKQLEEADLLIINKTDLITSEQLTRLSDVINTEYRGKIILHQNSLEEASVSNWLTTIHEFNDTVNRSSLRIDYDIYGEGESKLAWLDKSFSILSTQGDATLITQQLIRSIFDQIQSAQLPIGHLKFFIEGDNWNEKISFTTTSTGSDVTLNDVRATQVTVLINARVQTSPDVLKRLIDKVLDKAERTYNCQIQREKWSAFKPGYPRPTHRMAED